MLKRKWKLLFSLLLVSLLIVPALIVPASTTVLAEEDSSELRQLNEIYELIERYHVSGIKEDQLSKTAIEAMISELNDPYTKYMSESDWEEFQNSLQNNYVGIGIRVGQDDTRYYVVEVFDGSPAEAAGVLRGDYIAAVEGKSTETLTLDQLIDSIVGPENTEVTVSILHEGKTKPVRMTRKRIQVPVVTSCWFKEGAGYIRLSSFSVDADEQFAATLDSLNKAGIHSLIVDLRDNPGGLLETAAHIAEQFIDDGLLIHTRDRDQADHPVAINGESFPYPVVLLVNGGSASASEVLTGALQDYGLATVVGSKTYGKGSVQNVFQLSDGGVLKMTVEEYLTPKSRKVNHVGLEPDVEAYGDAAQLITALHEAGVHELTVQLNHSSLAINGAEFIDTFRMIREQGKVYVPSRVLAALIQGQVNWNAANKSVDISDGKSTALFPAINSGVMMSKGTVYLELALFAHHFSQLHWNIEGDSLQITVTKGK